MAIPSKEPAATWIGVCPTNSLSLSLLDKSLLYTMLIRSFKALDCFPVSSLTHMASCMTMMARKKAIAKAGEASPWVMAHSTARAETVAE